MLAKRIIPCLDVKEGRVVKGTKFQNLLDAGDPLELAIFYDQQGADELVFLDITATNEKRKTAIDLVKKLAARIFIPFTIGGGIQTAEEMIELVKAGADKVAVNSAAIANPRLIEQGAKILGSQCIVLAVDAQRIGDDWYVFSHAGTRNTGLKALEWITTAEKLGVGEIMLTSIDRDGTKQGFDIELTEKASSSLHIPLIASGGVGQLEHFHQAFVAGKADAALAASIFHQKIFSLHQVKSYLAELGVSVR